MRRGQFNLAGNPATAHGSVALINHSRSQKAETTSASNFIARASKIGTPLGGTALRSHATPSHTSPMSHYKK